MSEIVGTEQAAAQLGVTGRRIRELCREGRVVGAVLIGRSWAIPAPVQIITPAPANVRPGVIPDLPEFLAKRAPKPAR
jgi:hypothetical protein